MKLRLDQALVNRGLASTKSQARSYIELGLVKVNNQTTTNASAYVSLDDKLETIKEQYVSRAALKLADFVNKFEIDFNGKVVLDVGSSTGGFTDYALKSGAKKVIAVEIGSNQLDAQLRLNHKVELHENTDVTKLRELSSPVDIIVVDVSFTSLRSVLLPIDKLTLSRAELVLLVKPQFEAKSRDLNKGIVKNETIRRQIISDFEVWLKMNKFYILHKADSTIRGSKGNLERLYLVRKVKTS